MRPPPFNMTVLSLLVLASVGIVACNTDDAGDRSDGSPTADQGVASPPPPTADQSTPAEPESSPAASGRIGIETLDRIVEAVDSGSPSQIHEFLRFDTAPCDSPGVSLPCEPGQPQGTLVELLPGSVCVETAFTQDQFDYRLTQFTQFKDYVLYAVYPAPALHEPSAQYVVVFSRPQEGTRVGNGLALAIDDGQIVKAYFALPVLPNSCRRTADGLIDGLNLTDPIVPPPNQ